MATKKVKDSKRTLGALSDALWEQRERKRQLNEHMKVVEGEIDALTSELIERLQEEGLDSVKGSKASVTVTPSVVPQIEDWDAFLAYARKTNNLHLVQRRLSPDPWRELVEQRKQDVPGVASFVKKTINMRTIS